LSLREYLELALKVSRPRFWFYLLGPFTVGCIWGADRYLDLLNPAFFVYFLYFLFPANVLLYGVNDLYDYETDLLNPKKDAREYRVKESEREKLLRLLLFVLALSLALVPLQASNGERIAFLGFLFLGVSYSAPPLRFKSRLLLDSASNFLYALPGVFAYYQVAGVFPPAPVLLAAFAHTFAMHLFSAVPDVPFDASTGVRTTAVLLGERASLLLCFASWSVLAYIALSVGQGNPMSFLPLIYPIIVGGVIALNKPGTSVYWFYPYINVGLGGLLFLAKAVVTPWS
jgi:4-hydroxybenzoate polyprenyltransferase